MRKQTPQWYEIRIAERLDPGWANWFDGMQLLADPRHAETILAGNVRDQAALYGLLNRLRDLNLTLLAVENKTILQEAQK